MPCFRDLLSASSTGYTTYSEISLTKELRPIASMSAIRIASDVYLNEQFGQGEATQPRISAIDADVEYRRRLRESNTVENEDGIYNIRSRTAVPQRPKDIPSRSQDDDPGLRRGTDFKQKQVFRSP